MVHLSVKWRDALATLLFTAFMDHIIAFNNGIGYVSIGYVSVYVCEQEICKSHGQIGIKFCGSRTNRLDSKHPSHGMPRGSCFWPFVCMLVLFNVE